MKPYLEHIKMTSFGAFSNRVIGPFSPGLNVVYGPNEAGKTTTASFVRGVLFGWEEARGSRNTYKPEAAERAGSLFFADGNGGEVELSRARNADGLKGPAELVDDIDRETFSTMFSLTSDELRRLHNTTDVTARLLTAGSGTGTSPAHALSAVQGKLAECTSRASGAENSLLNLGRERNALKEQVSQATKEAEQLRRKDQEFTELSPQRDELAKRLSKLNARIEELTACRARLEKLESERDELTESRASLAEEEAQAAANARRRRKSAPRELMSLTAAEDRELRDRIDSLSEGESKLSHAADLAKTNYGNSNAAYEARLEAPDARDVEIRARHQRTAQIGLSVLLPLLFLCCGLPLTIHGREISSLSFTALGLGLIAMSVILAAGALFMLLRPTKVDEGRSASLQGAQWVMLKDRKKYESCVADQEAFGEEVRVYLAEHGLGEAGSSLRRARTLLDEAKDARSEVALLTQRRQAVSARLAQIDEKIAHNAEQIDALYAQAHLTGERATLAELDAKIARKSDQRDGVMEASEKVNRTYGELKQELSSARGEHTLDELKLQYQQVRTRYDEAVQNLARLLLARRMLEASISAWESKSQPEVYARASKLMSLMTDGRWIRVFMTPEGHLRVADAVRNERDPIHLSLGTCQQLYLSLRIALLLAADNVGRAIPILADDILVNFDSHRRLGAARALSELSRERQVIVFTCHEEVVSVLRQVDDAARVIELAS